jgi:hypothetical protein
MQSEEQQFWNDLTQRLPKPNYDRLNDSINKVEDVYDLNMNSNRSHMLLKNDLS